MANDIQAYYSARAVEYDSVYRKPERQRDLRALERWLPGQLSGRRVLEVACGTGYWTQFVASVAKSIVAIDAVPEVLEIARHRVSSQGATFLLGDAYLISPNIGAVDAAFAGFWFSHVPRSRQREFFLRLNERLEPGSQVIMFDNLYVEGSSSPIAESDDDGNTYQLRTLDNGTIYRVLKNFPTERELLALASQSGSNTSFSQWQYYWALTYMTPHR
jgi:demethylmenaquinone methyltransferase/2-methoxy-6-polyprenyl-1,4-benzoquinol methylase